MQNNPGQAAESIAGLSPETDAGPYLKALEIQMFPFAAQVAQDSFYLDAAREQLLNQLLHLVHSSGLLLVVTAEDGSGKSTLMSQFQQRAGSALRCCPITATQRTQEQDLLIKIAACLDLPDNLNKAAALELLEDQASVLQRNDLLPVILVDDADKLPADALALLLQLQHIEHINDDNNDGPWRIVLFTQPAFTAQLMQLNARMHFIHLPAMDEQQTGKYLLHRLRMVGFKQESPFTDRDIAFIHKHAQGNLTRVHQLAHQVLLKKYTKTTKLTEQKKMVKPRLDIKPKVWISMIVVIVLSVILYFQERINSLVESTNDKDIALPQQSHELPMPQGYVLKKIPDSRPALIDITSLAKRQSLADAEKKTTAQIRPPVQTEQQQVDTTPEQTPLKQQPAGEPAPASSTDTTMKADVTQAPVKVISKTGTGNKAVAELETMLRRHNIHGQSWIMQQAPTSFTAQLIGSSNPDTLYRLAKNTAMQGKAAMYHVLRKDKDWYVLIYGSYADKETTKKAVDKLPLSLRKGGPWLRSFEAVQAELKAGKK